MVRIGRKAAVLLLALSGPALAAPAPARPRRVAVLAIAGGEGFTPAALGTLEETVQQAFSAAGLVVVGRSDLSSILGFERQKQLAGCGDSSACLAELAGALGVDYLAATDIGRLGDLRILNLKLIDATKAVAVVRAKRTAGDDGQLVGAIDSAVSELVAGLDGKAPPASAPAPVVAPAPPGVAPSPTPLPASATRPPPAPLAPGRTRTWTWVTAAAGVAALATGAYFGWRGNAAADALEASPHAAPDAQLARARGDFTRANVLLGTGGTVCVGAGVLFFLGL